MSVFLCIKRFKYKSKWAREQIEHVTPLANYLISSIHAALPAWRREGTVLTAGLASWATRRLLERKERGERVRDTTFPLESLVYSVSHYLFCDCFDAMSTSRQHSESRAIPTRTVLINDTTQLPHDYCTTPGGTLFSTTPGGNVNKLCILYGGRLEIVLWQLLRLTGLFAAGLQQCGLCLSVSNKPNHSTQNKNKALRRLCCRFEESDWPSTNAVIEKHVCYMMTMKMMTVWSW